MLTAERVDRDARRRSPGFSLAEATRIRRDLVARKTDVECPRCAGHLGAERTGESDDAIWLTRCPDCGLSLMVHHRSGDIS